MKFFKSKDEKEKPIKEEDEAARVKRLISLFATAEFIKQFELTADEKQEIRLDPEALQKLDIKVEIERATDNPQYTFIYAIKDLGALLTIAYVNNVFHFDEQGTPILDLPVGDKSIVRIQIELMALEKISLHFFLYRYFGWPDAQISEYTPKHIPKEIEQLSQSLMQEQLVGRLTEVMTLDQVRQVNQDQWRAGTVWFEDDMTFQRKDKDEAASPE